jgi:hypothetical protein
VLKTCLSLDRCSARFRWSLCGAFSTSVLLLGEQACNHHEVIREHGSSHQKLEMLSTFCKTALHAATAEENGNAPLDAGAELLCLFELGALLKCFLLRRLFTATLRNAHEIDATIFALLYIVPAEKSSVATVYAWRRTEYFLVTLQGRFHVGVIRWIAIDYTVLSNEPLATFRDENLVAEFNRFQNLATFDQVGVNFKDRKELLFVGNLLSLDHSPTSLIDHPVSKAAIVIDFLANRVNCNIGHQIDAANSFRFLENDTRVFYYLAGCAYEFTILRNQLSVPLSCRHSLSFLHPAPRATGAVSESRRAIRKQIVEVSDQPCEDSYRVPQQRAIGWVVNVSFDHGRVDTQFLAVFQAQVNSGFDNHIIDRLKCCRSEPVKGSIESIMFGNTIAVETGESPQRIPVRDSFAQFAVIPVLDPHQGQGTDHLLSGQPIPSGLGILQATLKIPAHLVYQVTMFVNEIGNGPQRRLQAYTLGVKFNIGKTDLTPRRSCHFLAFAFLRFL